MPIIEALKIAFYLVGLLAAAVLYFLPAMVGYYKKHFDWIMLINLFLGCTVIGWVGALIWAVNSPVAYEPAKKK